MFSPRSLARMESKEEKKTTNVPKVLTPYEEAVQKHKQDTAGLSPLQKHINWFFNTDLLSTPESIAKRLSEMHSSRPDLKGSLIHRFNETHRGEGHCPFFKTTPLEKSLHLGTTRIWKRDGSVDEDRWQTFVNTSAEALQDRQVVTNSKLIAYLAACYAKDPEEAETGRQASCPKPISRWAQKTAAVQAWGQNFENLTCGWKINNNDGKLEPFIDLAVVREFFDDSAVAYLRAVYNQLPVPKPTLAPKP